MNKIQKKKGKHHEYFSNTGPDKLTCVLWLLLYQKNQAEKKGIQTSQLGIGKQGIPLYIEIAVGIANACIVIVEAISILLDWSIFPVWTRITGLIISTIGVILFIIALITMKDSWRAGVSKDKTKLVTNGIFQISRNPAFLGFDLMYLGILIAFFNWGLLIFSVFSILTLHLQIVNNEEEAMLEEFGDEYLEYKSTVNRYFGRR